MNGRLSWKAYAALITVYIIWSTTVAGIKLGVETIPAAMLPCTRFLLAGLILVGFCLLKGERRPSLPELRTHCMIGLLLFVGGNTMVSWTVQHMTTGTSGLMVATTPFWMVMLAAIMPPREKIPGLAIIGIVMGFIGMGILLSPQLTHLQNTEGWFWISVLMLLALTFSWSLGSIYARKHPTGNSLLMSVGLQNLSAGLVLVPVTLLLTPEMEAIHPSARSLMALGYLVMFGTIAATPCYLYVLKTLPVSVASTFAYVTPVLTMIFGAVFLGEPLTPNIVWGAAVILGAVIVVQLVRQQPPPSLNSPEAPTLPNQAQQDLVADLQPAVKT